MDAPRKPLAAAARDGRATTMLVKPTRWPAALWERFEAIAIERRIAVSEVLRECAITGLSMLEAQAAVQAHKGKTA